MTLDVQFSESNQSFDVNFGEIYKVGVESDERYVKTVNHIAPDDNGNVDVISDIKIAELMSALQ